jgi:uncharacterized membrane protein YeaQ/YmgE (transglycosylase-associated protein family)
LAASGLAELPNVHIGFTTQKERHAKQRHDRRGRTNQPPGSGRPDGRPVMVGFIFWLILVGLLAGLLARLIVPGEDPMGIVGTILLGIVGSFIGGFLADVLFRSDDADLGLHPAGIIGSIIGAVIALLVYRSLTRGRRTL